MQNVSVVIICKNAIATIERAIQSSFRLSKDVVIVDSGSTDGTLEKIRNTNAKLTQIEWKGYGDAKNYGNSLANNDWILSVDSDEYIDDKLINSINKFSPVDITITGSIKRLSYLGQKAIHHGEWGNDIVTRFFNKRNANWDTSEVHEQLKFNKEPKNHKLEGTIHHFTSANIDEQRNKLEKYAQLMAEKYCQKGKKAYWHKLYLAPLFSFIQNYIFKVGFLDGREGWEIAAANRWYSYRKYELLKQKDPGKTNV